MRASRLISLVLLLQAREMMTAGELADELGVSERTVYRDVLALSEAGIPVYADHGRQGGYRLVDGYRTRLTGLSPLEAEALFLSGLAGPVGEMGLADAVANARLKVLAALPPTMRDAPQRVGRRFHLDVPGWFTETAPLPHLAPLAQAVWNDQTIELRYRRDRQEVNRTVLPYGFVLKAGTWYLVARVGDDHRIYRVDRITGVESTGERFDRDESFDLPGFWADRAERFVESLLTGHVTLRLSPLGMRALRFAVEPPALREARATAGEPDADGWVTTRVPVESPEVAYGVALRLGAEAEVLEPASLRIRMAETAARLISLYGSTQR